jgi:glycosyltransferase involved in cell wall biosynthesis
MTYYRSAAEQNPDICGGFHILLNGLSALLTAKRFGMKSLYFCVGGMTEIIGGAAYNEHYPFGRTGRRNRVLENCLVDLVRRFDLIVTMGSGSKRYLATKKISSPIEVIPGGIDRMKFSPHHEEKIFDLIVTCRLVPVKRLDIFLQVVKKLSKSIPTIRAVIVGDGEQMNALKSMASSLGIDNHVCFAGMQKDVSAYLQKSRLFLLTSDSEGLALSLMEAMMCGLPAVTSDVGDLKDLVHNGVNGWLVPRRNVNAFAEKIVSILSDPICYQSFSEHARLQALRVSLPAITERWNHILQMEKDVS